MQLIVDATFSMAQAAVILPYQDGKEDISVEPGGAPLECA